MINCTCGASTTTHSIFCSKNNYENPFTEKVLKRKDELEVVCEMCFLLLNKSLFKKDSKICKECTG